VSRTSSAGRRYVATALLAVLAIVVVLGGLVTFGMSQGRDSITRMDIAVHVASDGSLAVTQTFDVRFVATGHGPYVYFVTRQATGTKNQYRELDYSVAGVTSPTGAPVDTQTSDPSYGIMAVRIGNPDTEVSGTQTYVLAYTVSGVVNPKVAASGFDELYWNVIGTGWTIPISNITVTLSSDVAISATQCQQGSSYSGSCAHTASGTSATYTQDSLSPGQGMAIVAGWPAGTFIGAEPRLTTHETPPPPFELTRFTGAVVGGAVIAVLLGGLLLWWRGKDQIFTDVSPGLLPMANDGRATRRVLHVPYAVRFSPPGAVSPGMVGTLLDRKADIVDVTATLTDLAVRGLIRFEARKRSTTPRIHRVAADPQGLASYERQLFDGLFPKQAIAAGTKRLTGRPFGRAVAWARHDLYVAVVEAGWFSSAPYSTKTGLTVGAVVALTAAIITLGVGAVFGWGLLAVPVLLVAVVLFAARWWLPSRTAAGSAVLSQTLGFKLYLETAEADQIAFEEAEDIFSRYLPYAIAFGCVDHWVSVFAELVDRGAPMSTPAWYSGGGTQSLQTMFAGTGSNSLSGIFDGLGTTLASPVSTSTVGSSGGSGFSGGGGGFSGGGMGGGGGGTW
jgi:uncharacterized membrane protein YgcG